MGTRGVSPWDAISDSGSCGTGACRSGDTHCGFVSSHPSPHLGGGESHPSGPCMQCEDVTEGNAAGLLAGGGPDILLCSSVSQVADDCLMCPSVELNLKGKLWLV